MIYFSTQRSLTGKRARVPDWWNNLIELVPKVSFDFLEPKEWTKEKAMWWARAIPPKCPFERQIWINNTLVLYIPPLCPFNPLSSQLYSIRLQALTYLSYFNQQG